MKFWVRQADCNCWMERSDDKKHYDEIKGFCHCQQPCCQIVEVKDVKELVDRFHGFTLDSKSLTGGLYAGTVAEQEVTDQIDGVLKTYLD